MTEEWTVFNTSQNQDIYGLENEFFGRCICWWQKMLASSNICHQKVKRNKYTRQIWNPEIERKNSKIEPWVQNNLHTKVFFSIFQFTTDLSLSLSPNFLLNKKHVGHINHLWMIHAHKVMCLSRSNANGVLFHWFWHSSFRKHLEEHRWGEEDRGEARTRER